MTTPSLSMKLGRYKNMQERTPLDERVIDLLRSSLLALERGAELKMRGSPVPSILDLIRDLFVLLSQGWGYPDKLNSSPVFGEELDVVSGRILPHEPLDVKFDISKLPSRGLAPQEFRRRRDEIAYLLALRDEEYKRFAEYPSFSSPKAPTNLDQWSWLQDWIKSRPIDRRKQNPYLVSRKILPEQGQYDPTTGKNVVPLFDPLGNPLQVEVPFPVIEYRKSLLDRLLIRQFIEDIGEVIAGLSLNIIDYRFIRAFHKALISSRAGKPSETKSERKSTPNTKARKSPAQRKSSTRRRKRQIYYHKSISIERSKRDVRKSSR
jgi:hypothetical protein